MPSATMHSITHYGGVGGIIVVGGSLMEYYCDVCIYAAILVGK